MKHKTLLIILLFFLVFITSCTTQENISILHYYDYDHDFPLDDSVRLKSETDQYLMYAVTYRSFHDAVVTALLSVPKNVPRPVPVIIFVHGVKDHKEADYMRLGHKYMLDSAYAVMRIDVANHGDRKIHEHNYDFAKGYRFWTRDIIAQTVFDLRRAVDFLETRSEIDQERIGYFGISLGGVIGTVFCGVDDRIKVPVIALAGGGLNLIFKFDALSTETANYVSIIDPINFVEKISPRPLLMLNAEKDEVIPPFSTKLLYDKAKEPKRIVWYPTKHRQVPQDVVFPEAIRWFNEHL